MYLDVYMHCVGIVIGLQQDTNDLSEVKILDGKNEIITL